MDVAAGIFLFTAGPGRDPCICPGCVFRLRMGQTCCVYLSALSVQLIQFIVVGAGGLVVAFIRNWKLAGVAVFGIPLVVGFGCLFAWAVDRTKERSNRVYCTSQRDVDDVGLVFLSEALRHGNATGGAEFALQMPPCGLA